MQARLTESFEASIQTSLIYSSAKTTMKAFPYQVVKTFHEVHFNQYWSKCNEQHQYLCKIVTEKTIKS
jgi:hypothetical protein